MNKVSKTKTKSKCKKYLQKKIGININEFKNGLYVSKSQAIAVAYSQVLTKHPSCKRIISKRSKKSKRSKRSKRSKDGSNPYFVSDIKILRYPKSRKRNIDGYNILVDTTYIPFAGQRWVPKAIN